MDNANNQHPYREAIDAFAAELARLESATAHAVAAEALKLAHAAWLRQEIDRGRQSGAALEEAEVFDRLLAESDEDPRHNPT